MPEYELVVLSDVHREGLYLRVSDGRMLMVKAGDAAYASKWQPNMNLTVRRNGHTGQFNLELKRQTTDQPIRAAWL